MAQQVSWIPTVWYYCVCCIRYRVGCVIPPLIGSANSVHSILPTDKFRSPRIELAYYVCITASVHLIIIYYVDFTCILYMHVRIGCHSI